MANVRIIQEASITDRVQLPIATAAALTRGEFGSYESDTVVAMGAATDDATFCGINISNHPASTTGNPNEVSIALKCQIEGSVTSASYSLGAGLKWAASKTMVADGDANTIAWSAELGTSVTSLKILIDVLALHKVFDAVSA